MTHQQLEQPEDPATLRHLNIEETSLPNRARRWLQEAGIVTIGQLVERTEDDLLSIRNFADTSLSHVKVFLSDRGLALQPPRAIHCDADVIRKALAVSPCGLTHREREIIKLRHGIDNEDSLTLEETGEIFKLTRERVRQIQKKAEEKVLACVMFHHPRN